MAQLCIQFAVTFIGIQIIQNNLVEMRLPSVSRSSFEQFESYTKQLFVIVLLKSIVSYIYRAHYVRHP